MDIATIARRGSPDRRPFWEAKCRPLAIQAAMPGAGYQPSGGAEAPPQFGGQGTGWNTGLPSSQDYTPPWMMQQPSTMPMPRMQAGDQGGYGQPKPYGMVPTGSLGSQLMHGGLDYGPIAAAARGAIGGVTGGVASTPGSSLGGALRGLFHF